MWVQRIQDAMLTAADPQWWGTPAGRDFAAELCREVGVPWSRRAVRDRGFAVEAAEVVDDLIVDFLTHEDVSARVASAVRPDAYLHELARRKVVVAAGHRAYASHESVFATVPARVVEEPNVQLRDAITATVRVLAPRSGLVEAGVILEAVTVLAFNPEQHQGHGHGQARSWPELRALGLLPGQITALVRVVWGARNRAAETSIIGGFLKDLSFDPLCSPTHALELNEFAKRMTPKAVAAAEPAAESRRWAESA